MPNIFNWLHLVSSRCLDCPDIIWLYMIMLSSIYNYFVKQNNLYAWNWCRTKCQQPICLKFRLLKINWKLIFNWRSFPATSLALAIHCYEACWLTTSHAPIEARAGSAGPPPLTFWSSARRRCSRRRLLLAGCRSIPMINFPLNLYSAFDEVFLKNVTEASTLALIGWLLSTKAERAL